MLILHGTTGSGANFLRPEFAGRTLRQGQPLDAARTFLILPDGIGHGGSSKPSDGLHARFPRYGYRDMIEAQHRLLTEGLKVDHLRLVMGTSMGGMHTWLWGETYPEFMDALLPLASLPTQISGRNRVWRRVIIDAIRNDPAWNNGEYPDPAAGPADGGRDALLHVEQPGRAPEGGTDPRAGRSGARRVRGQDDPDDRTPTTCSTRSRARRTTTRSRTGADQAPLVAINFEDDLINPPELGILEREIRRVPQGQGIVIPRSDRTRGHGTHTLAAVWKDHLIRLLHDINRGDPGAGG